MKGEGLVTVASCVPSTEAWGGEITSAKCLWAGMLVSCLQTQLGLTLIPLVRVMINTHWELHRLSNDLGDKPLVLSVWKLLDELH